MVDKITLVGSYLHYSGGKLISHVDLYKQFPTGITFNEIYTQYVSPKLQLESDDDLYVSISPCLALWYPVKTLLRIPLEKDILLDDYMNPAHNSLGIVEMYFEPKENTPEHYRIR